MDIRNSTLIHSVFLFLCIGCVHNRKRKAITKRSSDTRDLNSFIYLNSYDLIMKFNYFPESHPVVTEDGYVVNLFRIPKNGPPVLLVHGIGDSSDSWLVLGPKISIAYQLSDAGFDVWLYNSRGNKYSKRHTRLLSSKHYWNFSYEEMGSKDLPASIDYILSTTSRKKLSYVGFSQGTTIFFVLCSMKPEYNAKIKHAVLLAPVAWISKLQYPLIDTISQNLKELASLTERAGLHELFPSNLLTNVYHAQVCNETSPAKLLCDLEYYITYGLRNINNLPRDKLPVIASHIPAGSSTKTFVHFIQGYGSKMFQRYDYGFEENQMVYGSKQPPAYNISLVKSPVTLFLSESDKFSTTDDVETLISKLPNIINCIVLNKSLDFTHLEFVYGARVKYLINDPVVSILSDVK